MERFSALFVERSAVVAAGLVFSIGVTRLSVAYNKAEIISIAKKKGLILSVISVIFPLSFIARIVELSRFGNFTLLIMPVLVAALVFAGVRLYGKIK